MCTALEELYSIPSDTEIILTKINRNANTFFQIGWKEGFELYDLLTKKKKLSNWLRSNMSALAGLIYLWVF